jgi:hypothetical protein
MLSYRYTRAVRFSGKTAVFAPVRTRRLVCRLRFDLPIGEVGALEVGLRQVEDTRAARRPRTGSERARRFGVVSQMRED